MNEKPLFMKWTCGPTNRPPLSEGYCLHQYRRGGDEVLSETAFRESWLKLVVQMYQEPVEINFEHYYDDSRLPDDGFFLALDGEKNIAASAMVLMREYSPDSATLHMVVADIAHRGKGLGSVVVQAAMQYAYESGVDTMVLRTNDWRLPALAIYFSLGFIPVLNGPDMRQRWLAVMKQLNKNEIPVYDENEQLTTLCQL